MPTEQEQILAYQDTVRQIRDRVTTFARASWISLGSYRDADIDRLVRRVLPQVLAGERQVAQLTDAYLALLTGEPRAGVDRDAVSGTALRGVDPEEVYQRPGQTVWTELSKGKTPEAAIAAGMRRLLSLVDTDIQLARRLQEQKSMRRGGYEYYRRTLTGRENCMLCVLASTQRYHVGTLKPIHGGCDCGAAPVKANSDPGQVLNEDLLDASHDLVDQTYGNYEVSGRGVQLADGRVFDYRDIVVREHGELGPVLTWRRHNFTGPGDIAD